MQRLADVVSLSFVIFVTLAASRKIRFKKKKMKIANLRNLCLGLDVLGNFNVSANG